MTTNPASEPNPGKKPILEAKCAVSAPKGIKKKILVVDDDAQVRKSLQKLLRAEGYEVELAADGQESIERFNRERIDLLLLDLNLPGNSGWDVFGTLTSVDPFLPIIIITGRQNQKELAEGAGVGALMQKPLDVFMLLETIAELLAQAPETHLKRLVGLHADHRYVAPRRPVSRTRNQENKNNRSASGSESQATS